eukprot:2653854-Rhodomonas_salina.1
MSLISKFHNPLQAVLSRHITQASGGVYYEWNARQEVNGHVFLFNSRCPTTGKLVHFDPCRPRGELSQSALDLIADLKDKHTRARLGGEVLISSDSEEEVQRDDTLNTCARDSHLGILLSAIQHGQLTTYLHSRGMAASRVAGDNHCFYSSASNTPAHDYSELSVQEIRLRVSRLIRIRWDEADPEELQLMMAVMGRPIGQYVRGVVNDAWADELVMNTMSRAMGGAIAIWTPGPDHRTPNVRRDDSASKTILFNVQYVNMGRNGILNHYEPLHEIRNPEAPPSKKPTKRKRTAKKHSATDEERLVTGVTEGAKFGRPISTGKAKPPPQDRPTDRQKSDSLDSER